MCFFYKTILLIQSFFRYLAIDDSMNSMSYQYLVGPTTVSNIIAETCAALWNCLAKKVLPFSLSKKDWLNIERDFKEQWNFNHCIGAIDGKHVAIQVFLLFDVI